MSGRDCTVASFPERGPWDREPSPAIVAAFDYWRDKRNGRRMPARADLDPVDIPALLPNVVLVDVETEPQRFRYRVVGTAIVRYRKGLAIEDHTGCYSDEVDHAVDDVVHRSFVECARKREPVFYAGEYAVDRRHLGQWQRLVLPLSSDGAAVDMLLAVHVRIPFRAAPVEVQEAL